MHEIAEQLPGLAARHLDGLDRIVLGRAGRDGDARQVKQVMVCRLLQVQWDDEPEMKAWCAFMAKYSVTTP